MTTCAGCGSQFVLGPHNPEQIYCSHRCGEAHRVRMERSVQWRVCQCYDCTAIFEVTLPHKRYCSSECRARHKLFRRRGRPAERMAACAADDCDTKFVARNSVHRYCSKTCQNRVLKRRWRATPAGAASARRHAKRYREECAEYVKQQRLAYYRRTRDARLAYMKEYRRRKKEEAA